MRHDSKFATWIRSGGQSTFVLPLSGVVALEGKFSVVPDRLLDSIIDAYANRLGNGDADSGDGWTYRGRGLFQLTGRANYRAFTDWHDAIFGGDTDFEADPDRAAEPVYAVRSAVYFWLEHGLPALADNGLTASAVREITIRINGDDATAGERTEKMKGIRDGGQFDGICRFSVARPRFEDVE